MARSTMVVSVTRARLGFTVSDASREWELAVFITHWQSGASAFTIVLAEVDGVCYSKGGSVIPADHSMFQTKVVQTVSRICHHWDEMDREALKSVVRRQLSK